MLIEVRSQDDLYDRTASLFSSIKLSLNAFSILRWILTSLTLKTDELIVILVTGMARRMFVALREVALIMQETGTKR